MRDFRKKPTVTPSPDSIKQTAAEVAKDLLSFYKGGSGLDLRHRHPARPATGWRLLLVDWRRNVRVSFHTVSSHTVAVLLLLANNYTVFSWLTSTGDKQYDAIITRSLVEQSGENKDFMPANWTATMGNDDQGFWAMTAMLAAETNFPPPPAEAGLDWLALVQAVFNEQSMLERRVNQPGSNCNGGLRWQAFTAEYIDEQGNVHDGAHLPKDCLDVNKLQFSYNAAVLIQGAAYMYDIGVAYEYACEGVGSCNVDMRSFKGYLHRWVSQATVLAPHLKDRVMTVFENSTRAGVAACNRGDNGQMCGFEWTQNGARSRPSRRARCTR
ncbi:mannan endo-1-6-alpha-mannosidase DCW1-like protein [Apiospora phragmitis]|uniref:mannan endo-1,6-alpha-mannosidase n=1 Tax=Apiospora phragmitis TaxID=2905665 RepID=A0ABR1VJW2_9PEZI